MSQRNIDDVIDKIIEVIPEQEDCREILVTRLKELKRQAAYAAPERIGVKWNELGAILLNELGEEVDKPWKQTISDIMTGK